MRYIFLICFLTYSWSSFAETEVFLAGHAPGKFSRHTHAEKVLILALEKTKNEFGPYKLKFLPNMTRKRALKAVKSGVLSVHSAPTQPKWEKETLPVYFPLSKGLLSYRLLLIRKDDQKLYSAMNNSFDLKQYRAGLGAQWSTTKVLKKKEFPMVLGNKYEVLFGMLSKGRFDYFLRGVNEVFGEYENHKKKLWNIGIEKDLVIYIYMPIYLFVSPKNPKLHRRISKGLEMAQKDGSFERLFWESHGENIKLAKVKSRKLIIIKGSENLVPESLKDDKYWFHLR